MYVEVSEHHGLPCMGEFSISVTHVSYSTPSNSKGNLQTFPSVVYTEDKHKEYQGVKSKSLW